MGVAWTNTTLTRIGQIAALAGLVALALGSGCRHRRSAYRPVFVDPEPALIDATPSSATIIPTNPSPYDYQYDAAPIDSAISEDVPYLPEPAEAFPKNEPELNLSPVDPIVPQPRIDQETIPSGVGQPPEVVPPQTRRDTGVRRTLTTSRAELSARVQALADDPIDLVQPPKAERAWRFVVLHHSARPTGGYAQLDRDHRERGGLDGCGYHFVIGNGTESPDGTIEVTRRWSEQRGGAHCRDASAPSINEYGIGICLVGDLNATGPTPKQVESARLLVAYLQSRYRIDGRHVGTHDAFTSGNTVCPGERFPTQQILGRPNLAAR